MNSASVSIITGCKVSMEKIISRKPIFISLLMFVAAIQAMYFTQKLMLDKSTATVLYHTFSTMVFFMCVFGAIISDSFLGKFKTILYLSLVYALGSAIVAIGAIPTVNLSPM